MDGVLYVPGGPGVPAPIAAQSNIMLKSFPFLIDIPLDILASFFSDSNIQLSFVNCQEIVLGKWGEIGAGEEIGGRHT
jgi:hypothetical protein